MDAPANGCGQGEGMRIEFNGRVVAALFLGGICGVAATLAIAIGPIGRIQLERDNGRVTIEQQKAQIQQLQQRLAAQPTSQSQDPAVQVLNAVRPGLGTAVGALTTAAQKTQAAKAAADQQAANSCPAGSTPQTGPWQGLKCVAVDQ
jgi:hypothetical protein